MMSSEKDTHLRNDGGWGMMSAMPPLSQMLTYRGAARRAGCSERAIRAAIERGELKTYANADGTVVMVKAVAVTAWAEGRSFGAAGGKRK